MSSTTSPRKGTSRSGRQSTGTGLPDRQPGDPLPRLVLDGLLTAAFEPGRLATEVRIWWHSMAEAV
jgi:hypothetical protein